METLILVFPVSALEGMVIDPVTGVVLDAAFVKTVSPVSEKSPSPL